MKKKPSWFLFCSRKELHLGHYTLLIFSPYTLSLAIVFFVHLHFLRSCTPALFFGCWAVAALFTSSCTFTIANHAPLHTLFIPILGLFYILLAAPHLLIQTPHLLRRPPICDNPAPPYRCLLSLGPLYLFCAPPLTTHVPPYFCFPLSPFLIKLFLFIYLFIYFYFVFLLFIYFRYFYFIFLFLETKYLKIIKNYKKKIEKI